MSFYLRTTTGYTDLYLLIRGTTIAVPMTEGTGTSGSRWYTFSDAALVTAGLTEDVYDGAVLHGNYLAPSASDTEEATFSGYVFDGSTGYLLPATPEQIGGSIFTPLSPKYIFDNRRWRFDARDQNTAANILYDIVPLVADYFAMDFDNVLDPGVTIQTAVMVYTPTNLTIGTLLLETNLREVHIPITCSIVGTYTIGLKVTTDDSQKYIRRSTLILGNAAGT